MIGRGARGRPWLLGQIAPRLAGRRPPGAHGARLAARLEQYEAMLALLRARPRGSGRPQACQLVSRSRSRNGGGARPLMVLADPARCVGLLRRGDSPKAGTARGGSGGMSVNGFEMLWGAIPYPALVVDETDTIVTANPATESFGATSLRQMAGQAARPSSSATTAPCSTSWARRAATGSRWRSTT